MRVKRDIALRRAPGNPRQGRLVLAHGVRRAALGRSGIKASKREGDDATPLGRFPVRQVLYRADRVTRPRTRFALRAIRAELLSPLRDVVSATALELVDDFVPLPQEKHDSLLSGRALRYLARTMRQPKRAPQIIVRRLRKHLAMNGLGTGVRDRGVTS